MTSTYVTVPEVCASKFRHISSCIRLALWLLNARYLVTFFMILSQSRNFTDMYLLKSLLPNLS